MRQSEQNIFSPPVSLCVDAVPGRTPGRQELLQLCRRMQTVEVEVEPGAPCTLTLQVTSRPTAAIPMENPDCSCKLTPEGQVMVYSCNHPYGESLLQL